MSFTTASVTGGSSVNIESILAEVETQSTDQRKDEKITRNLHHQKRMDALDGNIDKLKTAQSETKKASTFKFVTGIIGTIISTAAKLLDLVVPGLGTIVSSVLKGATEGVQQMDPYSDRAADAQLDAKQFEKLAEDERSHSEIAQEHANDVAENQQTIRRRLEKALENQQQAQSYAVQV